MSADARKIAKAIHEGLRRNGTIVMYSAAFEKIVEAALQQQGEAVCGTCNGHGLIGGFVFPDQGYQDEPCPDCNKQGEAVATVCLVGERYAHGNMVEVQLQLTSEDSALPKIGDRYFTHPPKPVVSDDVNDDALAAAQAKGAIGYVHSNQGQFYIEWFGGNQLPNFAEQFLYTHSQQDDTNWLDDAEKYGNALNAAGWTFLENCPEKSALLFNNVKPALRAAILEYGKQVSDTRPPKPVVSDEESMLWPHLIARAERNGHTRDVGESDYDYLQRAISAKSVGSDADLDVIALNAMRECWDAADNSEPRSQTSSQSRAKMQIIIRDALNAALGVKS